MAVLITTRTGPRCIQRNPTKGIESLEINSRAISSVQRVAFKEIPQRELRGLHRRDFDLSGNQLVAFKEIPQRELRV